MQIFAVLLINSQNTIVESSMFSEFQLAFDYAKSLSLVYNCRRNLSFGQRNSLLQAIYAYNQLCSIHIIKKPVNKFIFSDQNIVQDLSDERMKSIIKEFQEKNIDDESPTPVEPIIGRYSIVNKKN